MSESAGAELTAEGLLEALAEAGEFDAGVEVLDVLRARDPELPGLMKLQARLFAAPPPSPEQRRKVMETLRSQGVDALARRGALAECAVACKVLAAAFPDEVVWANRRDRFALVVTALPNVGGDSRRPQVDKLIASGSIADAYAILRELLRESPADADLARRQDLLRGLLFDPAHTRPYRAVPTGEAARILGGPPQGESIPPAPIPAPMLAPVTEPPPAPTVVPDSVPWTADDVTAPDAPPTATPVAPPDEASSASIVPAPGGDVSVQRRKIVRLA